MKRLLDPLECTEVTRHYDEYFSALDAEEWLSNEDNYALVEGENVAFAEYKKPGLYWVHFCFHTARGREAITLTNKMLENLYSNRQVKMVIGLIETRNKPARWLIRQVGLKSLGEVDTKNGPCEMFYQVRN